LPSPRWCGWPAFSAVSCTSSLDGFKPRRNEPIPVEPAASVAYSVETAPDSGSAEGARFGRAQRARPGIRFCSYSLLVIPAHVHDQVDRAAADHESPGVDLSRGETEHGAVGSCLASREIDVAGRW